MSIRPHCRYCGKPIAKRTTNVRFVDELKSHMKGDQFTSYVVGMPQTKAEAQRLVNQQIVSVKRSGNPWGRDPQAEYITEAGVWDGESYVDPYFCNGAHAKDFAYMVARDRPTIATKDYFEAIRKETAHA